MKRLFIYSIASLLFCMQALAEEDLNSALKRAQYLLNGTIPGDDDFATSAVSKQAYDAAVRAMIEDQRFYDAALRYHEKVLGVGLPDEYIGELIKEDIDGKQDKFASITCDRITGPSERFVCAWSKDYEKGRGTGCPVSSEIAASVFWYPGIAAWVCPSVINNCGHDLSKCFIQFADENAARNAELGATESFDSRFAVIKSLSRQAAGMATAIAVENYPYTKILEPGLTAIDGAIAHFYQQEHHFKISDLNIDPEVLNLIPSLSLTDTRFRLLKTSGNTTSHGGVISSFGWLRRYDKNRTRANELYKRLLCREFTAELPAIFPQDPGNLREAPGCADCHSVLDPLADFFAAWGEGAGIYESNPEYISTSFAGCNGSTVAELASCVQQLPGFKTCTVQNVWHWLMGRGFYTDEEPLRDGLVSYFETTNFSFKELVYAISTHPAFVDGQRTNALVTDPLAAPPLGEIPTVEVSCEETIDYATDIAPLSANLCEQCHSDGSSRQSLTTEAAWQSLGRAAVGMMFSGSMPPGGFNDDVQTLANNVQCWLEQ